MQEQVIRLASLIALQRHHVSWLLYYIIGIISLIFDFGIVPTVWYFMFFILPWDKNNANFYVMHEETTRLVCVSRHVIKGLAVLCGCSFTICLIGFLIRAFWQAHTVFQWYLVYCYVTSLYQYMSCEIQQCSVKYNFGNCSFYLSAFLTINYRWQIFGWLFITLCRKQTNTHMTKHSIPLYWLYENVLLFVLNGMDRSSYQLFISTLNIFYCQAIIDNGSHTSYKHTRSSPYI